MELTSLQARELSRMVDKYESRRDYAQKEKSSRRTMLTVEQKKYPGYYHVSDSSFRITFNQEMGELEAAGLVDLEWVRFDRGNALKRIILRQEALPQIYRLLKRVSRKEEYRQLMSLFSHWQKKSPSVLGPFFQAMLAKIQKLLPLPLQVNLPTLQDYEDLFIGLTAFFTPRHQEILKRQLSVNLFRDSKRWGELERSILWVVKTYLLSEDQIDLDDGDILSEHNILANPHHLNLAGPLTFSTDRGRVAVSSFHPDVGLSPFMVQEMVIEECTAGAIVTVENLTSFYQYLYDGPKDHLVLYLGGYHNRPRRLILTKLRDFFAGADAAPPFYHWGDMDLGGFRIWHHLCQKTDISVEPLLMDPETYLAHISSGQIMEEGYMRKLAELLENPAYSPLRSLINMMLEKGIRVEQEAVVIKNP